MTEPTPIASTPVKTITLQAKDGVAISRDSNGMVKTWDILTGLHKASFQTPVLDLKWNNVQLINSGLVLVWHTGNIKIWDVEKGELLQTMEFAWDGNNAIDDIKMSGDGSKVFCLCWKTIQALSVLTGEVVGEVTLQLSQPRRSLTVDGSRVWVLSPLAKPLGWDFGIPDSLPVQLPNPPSLCPNNIKLWDTGRSRIKDAVTRKVAFQLAGRFAKPVDSQWDGRYLVAGYKSGEVLILDFIHMLS